MVRGCAPNRGPDQGPHGSGRPGGSARQRRGRKIITGLKKQGFLTAQGKNIVPTDRGFALFGVLKRADPALVDPDVTAELWSACSTMC